MNTKTIVVFGQNLDALAVTLGLSRHLALQLKKNLLRICLVFDESQVGMAPAVVTSGPKDREFWALCGVNELQLLSECEGQYSWGFHFQAKDRNDSEAGYFCFGEYGFSLPGIPFQHIWKKYCEEIAPLSFHSFSLAAECASQGKFCRPQKDKKSMLSGLDFGINITVEGLKKLFINLISKENVQVYNETAASFLISGAGEDAVVDAVELSDGRIVQGDLFVDTSNNARLYSLLSTHYRVHTESRFTVMQCENVRKEEDLSKLLVSLAHEGGEWLRVEETSHRRVQTLFSSAPIGNSSEQRLATLSNSSINGVVSFSAVSAATPWIGNAVLINSNNCLGILGVVSPIECIYRQVKLLLNFLPGDDDLKLCARGYNIQTQPLLEEMAELQAFFDIGYGVRELTDIQGLVEAPGKSFYSEKVLQRLLHRLSLFAERGRVAFSEVGILSESEWASLLIAMGVVPDAYDPILQRYDFLELSKKIAIGLDYIKRLPERIPLEHEYRKQYMQSMKNL